MVVKIFPIQTLLQHHQPVLSCQRSDQNIGNTFAVLIRHDKQDKHKMPESAQLRPSDAVADGEIPVHGRLGRAVFLDQPPAIEVVRFVLTNPPANLAGGSL